jgi:hypothetical protein
MAQPKDVVFLPQSGNSRIPAIYLEVFSLLAAEQLIDVIDRVMMMLMYDHAFSSFTISTVMMLMYVRACRQQLHHFDPAPHHALLERICEKTSFSLSKFPYVCPEPVLVK